MGVHCGIPSGAGSTTHKFDVRYREAASCQSLYGRQSSTHRIAKHVPGDTSLGKHVRKRTGSLRDINNCTWKSIRRQVSLIVDIGIAKSQVSHFVRWPRRFEHNESWHHVPVASPLVSISFWFLASCSVSCVRLIFSLLMLATRASISSPSLKCVKWSSTPSGSFIWDE